MKKVKAVSILLLFLLTNLIVQAQGGGSETKFGEIMRSNGRIYVVVAVILTILIGLLLYLVRLEKKIGKMEKEQ